MTGRDPCASPAVCLKERRNVGPGVLAIVLAVSGLLSGEAFAQNGSRPEDRVATIAGPGLCVGVDAMKPLPHRVGALAVDRARVFVDAGPPNEGLVRGTDGVTTTFLRTGASLEAGSQKSSGKVPVEHRLAPDGKDGVFVTTGDQVVSVNGDTNSIATVAGRDRLAGDKRASSGDGGSAALAQFSLAQSIATDEDGNLFIADVFDEDRGLVKIRFVNLSQAPVTFYSGTPVEITVAPGNIETIAGLPGRSSQDEMQYALNAVLRGSPPSMAITSGRLYLGLTSSVNADAKVKNVGIQVVNLGGAPTMAHGIDVPPGMMRTVAGGGRSGFRGDGGPARSAAFSHLPGMAADQQGNLYVADQFNHRVRRIDGRGMVATVAGKGGVGVTNGGFNGNDRPAADALLNQPFDVEVGSEGVYISDRLNGQVRVIDQAGAIRPAPGNEQSTVCSLAALKTTDGRNNDWGFDGFGPNLSSLYDLAADQKGNIFFVYLSNRGSKSTLVQLRGSNTKEIRPFKLDRPGGKNSDGRRGIFDAMAVAGPGNVYVNEGPSGRIRFVNLTSKPIRQHGVTVGPGRSRVVAGKGRLGRGSEYGPARKARFAPVSFGSDGNSHRSDYPSRSSEMVADKQGNLFVADIGNQRIRLIDKRGIVSTVAGEGGPPELQECCRDPFRMAGDGEGNLYVSRATNPLVFLINRGSAPLVRHGQVIEPNKMAVVAGNGTYGLASEGEKAAEAPIRSPFGMVLDDKGNLYIARSADHSVVRVDANGILTTVVGTGQAGFNGDGLPPLLTTLNWPFDLAIDQAGDLLIADTGNNRIRRVNIAS